MSADEGRQTFTTSDGRTIRRPRKKAVLRDRYQDVIDGIIDIDDLDEEELFRGRLRGNDGHFRGVPPKVIPWAMHKAYVDRVGQVLERTVINSMPDVIDQLIAIATGDIGGDTGIAMDVQAKAAMYLTDRILGRPTERQSIDVKVQARWEQALEGGSLVVDIPDPDIIDAELVAEDPPALPSPDSLVERTGGHGRAPDGAEGPQDNITQSRPRPQTGVKLR